MSRYLCHNGDLVLSQDAVLKADNRCFNYGDGVFETVRCVSSKPLFFDKHYLRIKQSLKILKIKLPETHTQSYFERIIYRLLQKNRLYKDARVRITFFREAGGLYTPTNSELGFVATASPLEDELFCMPDKGVHVGVYSENKKQISTFSGLKTCNSMLFVLAGIWKKEQQLDDCLIMNEDNKIIEGLSSNIFVVSDNAVYTTDGHCGCVKGTMQRTILEICEANGTNVSFTNGFTVAQLLEADEIFLTNAIQGVVSVSAFQNRRYFHKQAVEILGGLNKKVL